MSKSYRNMMGEIHAPDALKERVLFAARQGAVQETRGKQRLRWKPALCTACAISILIGGFSLYGYKSGLTDPMPEFPFEGLVMTACAAEAPTGSVNGGIGLAMEKDGSGDCLFQIQGEGIKTLKLSIEGGKLYRKGQDESFTEITEEYRPDTRYGVLLEEPSATLAVEANEERRFTYVLTEEELRLTQDEAGKVMLVPRLAGDPAPGTAGVYATSLDSSRWLTWPLQNDMTIDLSMPYGERTNPATGQTLYHPGIDIPAAEGTAIEAAADGKVVESGFDPSDGFYVVLDHGGGLVTRYHHCKQICAEDGGLVRAGETIALVGKTGMATGPHLHFEVRQDGVAQNPTAYFDAEIRAQLDMK